MNFWIPVRKLGNFLVKESNNIHKHITNFNPDVMSLEQSHRDFLSKELDFEIGNIADNF